jgi:hypothetical protein
MSPRGTLFDSKLLAAYANSTLTEEMLPRNLEARQEALHALAEVEYRLHGTSKCSICRAPVRAAMKSVGVDDKGKRYIYQCLCRRCLEAEKAYCRTMTSYVAGMIFDEFLNKRELIERSAQAAIMAAA